MDPTLSSSPPVLSPPRGRDHELVSYVGRHGVVSIGHVMAALGVGQASAYRRVAACIDRGLLERLELLRREPNLLRATRAGLSYAGLGLPVAVVSPGAVDHWLRCASTALLLAEEFGAERVITERELRLMERLEGRPIASAKLGELPSGHPRLHRPDLVVRPESGAAQRPESLDPFGRQAPSSSRTQGGGRASARACPDAEARSEHLRLSSVRSSESRGQATDEVHQRAARTEDTEMRSAPGVQKPIAVEVELTPKAPRRLISIVRAWRGADCVAEVRYLCEPGVTRRAVDLAIDKTYASPKVRASEVVAR
jgi:hypothetical protein